MKDLLKEAFWLLMVAMAFGIILHSCATARGDIAEAMDAIVRVRSSGRVGTGCVFRRDEQSVYVLTNDHVVEPDSNVKCEFFVRGVCSKPLPGRVIFHRRHDNTDQDVAVVQVATQYFGPYLPHVVPLAKPGTVKYVGPFITCGCPEGNWASAYKASLRQAYSGVVIFSPAPKQGRSGSPLFNEAGTEIVGLVAWNNTQEGTGIAQTVENLALAFDGKEGLQRSFMRHSFHPIADPAGRLVDVVRPGERLADCFIGPDGRQYCLPPGQAPPQGFRPWGGGFQQRPEQQRPQPGPEEWKPDPPSGRYEAWPQEPPRSDTPKTDPRYCECKPVSPPVPNQSPQTPEVSKAEAAGQPAWYERFGLGDILGVLAAGALGGFGLKAWLAGRVAHRVGDRIQERIVEKVKEHRKPQWQAAVTMPTQRVEVVCRCEHESRTEPKEEDVRLAEPDPIIYRETVEKNRNRIVPVRDTSTDRAWSDACAKVVDAYPGSAHVVQQIERVKELILSGEENPRV